MTTEYKGINFFISSNANCHIKDGYLVTDTNVMRAFIEECMFNSNIEDFKKRSVDSYIREWKAHNWLYKHNLFVDRTKDTDLDADESKIRRIGYYIISLFC